LSPERRERAGAGGLGVETTLDEVSRGLKRIGRWLANLGMHRAADELIEIGRALDDIAPLIAVTTLGRHQSTERV
jgi:hypothetical protein